VGTTVETYGWVRLTLPPGVDEVGVRATAADGFVTRSYSAVLTAGASGVAVPAFPAAALADYLGGMGIEPAPGAGHLWGFVEWSSGADPLAPKDLLVDPYVGCATVAMEPAGPQLYYSSPKTGWPDVTAEHTHPDYATWWAYNVPAAPLKLTADAGGKILVVDIPAIEPGGITLVNMLYAPPECAAHPEPAGCSEQE
jgi:hypothetical protein